MIKQLTSLFAVLILVTISFGQGKPYTPPLNPKMRLLPARALLQYMIDMDVAAEYRRLQLDLVAMRKSLAITLHKEVAADILERETEYKKQRNVYLKELEAVEDVLLERGVKYDRPLEAVISEEEKRGWTYVSGLDGEVFIYNELSIGKYRKRWFKHLFITEASRIEYRDNMKKKNATTDGYEKFSLYQERSEFDCDNNRVRVLEIAEYDVTGRVLFSAHEQELKDEWKAIVPQSLGHFMLIEACK